MSEQKKLRVNIEFGNAKADFEGDVNQVFEAIIHFITQIYPNLEIVQNIIYIPNLVQLAEKLVGLVEITSEGPILISGFDQPAKNMILLTLLGSYVGSKLGKIPKDTLSSIDLAKVTGKARKTVSNEIPRLISEGLVERTLEGEYRLTTLGIRKTEDITKTS